MTKKLFVFFALIGAPLFLNAQCGTSYLDSDNAGPIPTVIGMSFTTDASCGGILASINVNLDSPVPTATVTVRIYEGDGLAGNLLGELSTVGINQTNDIFDFSALMIIINPSSQYTFTIEKDNASDFIIANIGSTATSPYIGGTSYWGGIPSTIKLPFQALIDNSTLSINDTDVNETVVKVYPNPSSNFIQLTSVKQAEKYAIVDISGRQLLEGIIKENEVINIQQLTKGIYFIQLEKKVLKFIKN